MRTNTRSTTVLIGGVEVTDSAAAELATMLQARGETALAMHVGLAIDHLRTDFYLTAHDREVVLATLEGHTPEGLEALRAAILNGRRP